MFDFSETPRINHMDDAAIKVAIRKVAAHYNSKAGRENLHVLLVACCHHAVQHKDCTHLTDLFNRLPANANKDGIKEWLAEYSTFKWMANKDKVKMFLGRDKDNAKSFLFMLTGETVPFYDLQSVKAKQDKEYSLIGSLEALIKTGLSKRKNGKLVDPTESILLDMLAAGLPSAIASAKEKVANKPEAAPAQAEEIAPLSIAA